LVVGFLVASMPPEQRKFTMGWGITAATLSRILLAFFAVQLLHITGLLLAGGILLVWVAWKMARDYHHLCRSCTHTRAEVDENVLPKHPLAAIWQIIVADISMSLDNVLGVAGIARDHMGLLAVGLGLSVALMGLASTQVARLAVRYPKVALIGTGIVLYTALSMIYDGGQQIGWWGSIHDFV